MGKSRTLPTPVTFSLWSQSWCRLYKKAAILAGTLPPPRLLSQAALPQERRQRTWGQIHPSCTSRVIALTSVELFQVWTCVKEISFSSEDSCLGQQLVLLSECLHRKPQIIRTISLAKLSQDDIVWQHILSSYSAVESETWMWQSRLFLNLLQEKEKKKYNQGQRGKERFGYLYPT